MADTNFAQRIGAVAPIILFKQTADKTITNTVSETSIIGTGTGSLTLAADFWTVGKTIRLSIYGIYSTPVGIPSILVKVKHGSTVLAQQTTTALGSGASGLLFYGDTILTCRSIGTSGTLIIGGELAYSVSGGKVFDRLDNSGSTVTINTTISNLLDVTVAWDSASSTRIAKSTICVCEVL